MQSASVKTYVLDSEQWEHCETPPVQRKAGKKPHLISVRIRKVQQHREKKGSSLLTRCFAELSAYAIAMRAGGIYHILSLLSSKCLDNSSTSTEKSWEKASVCRTWCMTLLHSWLNHYMSHYSCAIKLVGLILGPLLALFLTKFLWLFQP